MARRASSGTNPTVIIVTVLVIGGLVAIGVAILSGNFSLFGNKNDQTDGYAPLKLEDYRESANSMRGHKRTFEGMVDQQLRRKPDSTQIISVKIEENGQSGYIPVKLEAGKDFGNISPRQSYTFNVTLDHSGIAVAEEIFPITK